MLNGVEEGKAQVEEGGRDEKVACSQKKPNWRPECKNQYPIYDQNGWKTIPFGAAHTCIAHLGEYLPGGGVKWLFAAKIWSFPYTKNLEGYLLNSCS